MVITPCMHQEDLWYRFGLHNFAIYGRGQKNKFFKIVEFRCFEKEIFFLFFSCFFIFFTLPWVDWARNRWKNKRFRWGGQRFRWVGQRFRAQFQRFRGGVSGSAPKSADPLGFSAEPLEKGNPPPLDFIALLT